MATCLISIQVRDNIDPIEQLMGNYKQIILYLFTLNEILAQKVSIQMDILTTMQCIAMVYVDFFFIVHTVRLGHVWALM